MSGIPLGLNNYIVVERVEHDVIIESYLFIGADLAIKKAEQKFLELCKETIFNWHEYNIDNIDDMLDNGYVEYENGCICIVWPEMRHFT